MKTIKQLTQQLKEKRVLIEYIQNKKHFVTMPKNLLERSIHNLSYNSLDNELSETSLFIVKGSNFKNEYLMKAVDKGVQFYLSEIDFEIPNTTAIIVTDIEQAMAIVAQYFYDFPDEKLQLIGVTGTKGKTTTTYFLKDSLSHTDLPAGLINSKEVFTGKNSLEANLTTPESLDTYRYLSEMVENGLKYCVLEVSSQAYKKNRVHLLTFDLALFLNFSPDHVGTGEHESMNEYFYCKRQLLHHSRKIILNNDLENVDFIIEDAKENNGQLEQIITFSGDSADDVDYTFSSTDINHFELTNKQKQEKTAVELKMLGYYNHENATASLIAGDILGENLKEMAEKIKETDVSGRFEVYQMHDQIIVIDAAHNETSFRNVIQSGRKYYGEARPISIVASASGNKAENRRAGMARVFTEEQPRKVYIAADSPNFSKMADIAHDLISETKKLDETIKFDTTYKEDRQKQIEKALSEMKKNEIIFILGKGTDKTQRMFGKLEPYIGDDVVVEQWLEKNK